MTAFLRVMAFLVGGVSLHRSVLTDSIGRGLVSTIPPKDFLMRIDGIGGPACQSRETSPATTTSSQFERV